jgi:hypothetical protein
MPCRFHRVLCGAVLLLQLAGCTRTTWGRQRGAPSVRPAGTSLPQARLILRDGPPLTLSDVIVRSDSVSGYLIDQGSRSRMAFAQANVIAVETQTQVPNHLANFGIVLLGSAALLMGVLFLLFGSDNS